MADLLNPTTLVILIAGLGLALVLSYYLAKDPSYGLVLMAFFLPFERIPSFDFAGFTFKINHFVGGLTFIFWLLALLFQGRKIAPNPLAIPLTAMLFSFLLSGTIAENSFRQITVYISILIMMALYLVTVNGVTSKKLLQQVISFLFLGAGLMSLIGIYQFFGDLAGLPPEITGLDGGYTKIVFGFPRVHAFSKEPLYYANYLFIPLGIALGLFFSDQHKDQSVSSGETLLDRLKGPWLLPLIILILINFFLTLSRGAFIASVPFALIFIVFYARRILTFKNIALGLIVGIVSLSSVYLILDSVSYDALDRFLGHAGLEDVLVKKQGESGFGRLEDFGQALEAWQLSPALGIGLGNFGPYVKAYPLEKPPGGWEIVNNEYLELLAETGVLGLGSFLVALVVAFWRSAIAYRAATDEYLKAVLIGLTAALLAMLVQYNFFSTLYIIHIWIGIGLLIGVQNLILKRTTDN